MRLSEDQIEAIRQAVIRQFGPEAEVWIFGSRLDDSIKGGDIDVMVQCSVPVEHPARAAARFAATLERRFQGHSVDVVLAAPNLKLQPVMKIAREQGIKL